MSTDTIDWSKCEGFDHDYIDKNGKHVQESLTYEEMLERIGKERRDKINNMYQQLLNNLLNSGDNSAIQTYINGLTGASPGQLAFLAYLQGEFKDKVEEALADTAAV
jgi:hypothetical protein